MSKRIPKRLEEDIKNIPRYKIPTVESLLSDKIGKKVENHTVERAAFDELFGSISAASRAGCLPNQVSDGASSPRVEDAQFTAALVKRLSAAEAESKRLRSELTGALVQLEAKKNEINEIRSTLHVCATKSVEEEIRSLRNENKILSNTLKEMKQFLADYGLVWVGHGEESQDIDTSQPSTTEGHICDFSAFQRKVQELNDLVSSEPAQIKTEEGPLRRARLVHSDENLERVSVEFYRNGIMVKRGPFRPCASESYFSFMRDILDGFFPSEFRKEYPDGVLFEVKDFHREDFNESGIYGGQSNKLTKNQLLNKLPKIVVRNGQVMNIRDEVAMKLAGGQRVLYSGHEESAVDVPSSEHGREGGRQVVHIQPLPAPAIKPASTQSTPSKGESTLLTASFFTVIHTSPSLHACCEMICQLNATRCRCLSHTMPP